MKQSINQILKEVLTKIDPLKEELNSIDKIVRGFIAELERKIKTARIDAEVFVGGSFAKRTMIKKGVYDVDIFVRFNEKYRGENISGIVEKLVKGIKKSKISRVHGSRDYFKVEPENQNFFMEIIPVIKVKNPKEAENITDLSYFHVNYVRRKLKTEKILDEIRIAKAFCHANKCYGAESYISGFSGYALELLIIHYKNFLNFVKAITKMKEKEIIDIEKLYRNKYELNMNMNSAKMTSPIVIIDPTFKERNALAALSRETFENSREVCRKFLKNPSAEMFELKEMDFEKEKKKAQKNNFEFILLGAETSKQEGDVAGSKLVKFYRHFTDELGEFYEIKNKGFEYNGKKEAKYFFAVRKRKEIIISGPETRDRKDNIKKFRMRHKNVFEKNGRFYAREKVDKKIREFVKDWMNENSQKILEMSISELKIED
ncbi:MAG: nucleotidyltransferase domain-containing protein [Candidatus Nanoarchaeia archaeon]|nr:nucleotidyltransferase domain-containing protein [Candidatus Nanoarchaeia archaeon]MDD5357673.1 nucleotidyltransferase domain-containing protein [Candidatus Nanoarchaeia archaeon]MDD5588592.1 nucleotidyltransferase domain-containing protein [Candidatus Nanoarchaeia archaeon]